MVQTLGETVWRFLKNLKIELPYDPAISLPGIIQLKEKKSLCQRDIYIPMVTAALFKKQTKCPFDG